MARTAAISACMMAAPARSPETRTTRFSRMRGFLRQHVVAFEIAVEGNAVGEQIANARRALPRRRSAATSLIDDAGAGRDRVGGVQLGLSPSPTAAAMPPCAQMLEAPSPSGAAAMTVTGSGASFSAVNRPGKPGADDDDVAVGAERVLARSRKPRYVASVCVVAGHAQSLQAEATRRRGSLPPALQFVRLTMRSTARRAFAATAGSTVTS